jgi:hypothetical protein
MRSRNIKPGFFMDVDVGECTHAARLLFIGLWCFSDKQGKFLWEPKRIKAEIFPYDEVNIEKLLSELNQKGFIIKYSVNGKSYGAVLNFSKHQHPHHTEKDSEIPNLPSNGELPGKTTVSNGDNPSDSLIPDSLIPDSSDNKQGGKDRAEENTDTKKLDFSQLQKNTDKVCKTLGVYFKKFNFYAWRQEQVNKQQHPEAIEECLNLLWKYREGIKKGARAYLTHLMKIKGPNAFEREEIAEHEKRKKDGYDESIFK